MKKAIVYKIKSPTGRIYVGSSINITVRLRQYRSGNCSAQHKLYRSILKYGWNAHKFEIIFITTQDNRRTAEARLGMFFRCLDDKRGLNLSLPKIGDYDYTISESTREKMSESAKNKPPRSKESIEKMIKSNTGKKRSALTKERISKSHTGKFVSDLTKSKQSESAKKRITPEFREKMRLLATGRTLPESAKEKLRKHSTGKIFSEQRKQKISKSKIGKKRPDASTLVIDLSTGIFYDSIKEAAFCIGYLNAGTLRNMIMGAQKNKTTFAVA